MNNNVIVGIISLILGLICIICPLTGYLAGNIFFGLSILFLGIYAIALGAALDNGAANIVLGIIFAIIGIIIFFNPAFLAVFASFIMFFNGILLIVFAIMNLFTKGESITFAILGIIFGFILLLFAYLVHNPIILGVIIGLWFVTTGIAKIVTPEIA
ncbi:MAG: DUF308 domain-containing protein [archaeon]|nr:DUF308 domain-containing protein [archaeon]